MGTARYRSKIGDYERGTMFHKTLNTWSESAILLEQVTCEDVIGNYMGENPFKLDRTIRRPVVYSGETSRVILANHASSYNPSLDHIVISSGRFRDPTQTIASMHPGEPAVSIPNFLYEMKDVPAGLRHLATRAQALHRYWLANGWRVSHRALRKYYSKRRLGQDWLNYHFGWAPLFADLADIAKLNQYVQRRAKQFKRIRNASLRVSGDLGSITETQTTTNVSFQSFGYTSRGTLTRSTTRQRWFSAIYSVDTRRFPRDLNPTEAKDLAAMLGFSGSNLPISIWNALPWTWLSDWFFNVGSLIQLHGNRQGCTFRSAMIMNRNFTREDRTVITVSQGITYVNGYVTRETKSRSHFSPSFVRQDAGYNIFSASHLATLASLKVTRLANSRSF